MNEPPEAIEIGAHALRIDDEPLDDGREPDKREIERDRGVGPNDPLDGGMGNVPFVPERHVLERGHGVAPDDAGEAGHVLRQHRVALMRHRGGALLALAEELLGFQHLGPLQMPDLGGEPLHRARDDRKRGEIRRVAVPRHDLGGDRLRLQVQLLRHIGFDPRVDMGEGAHRAGDGAGRDFLAGADHALPGAGELRIGHRQLQAERRGLRMDAVAPSDGDCVLVLVGARLEGGEQRVEIGDQDVGGLRELDVEAGVEHVGGGEARMQVARFRPDMLGDGGEEGDDVVLHLPFDGVDPLDVEAAALFGGLRRRLGDKPQPRHGLGGIDLDLEPDAEFGFRLPDAGHLGAAVAGDHAGRTGLSRQVLRQREGLAERRTPLKHRQLEALNGFRFRRSSARAGRRSQHRRPPPRRAPHRPDAAESACRAGRCKSR